MTPTALAERLYATRERMQTISQAALTHGYVTDPDELALMLDAMSHIVEAIGDTVIRSDTMQAGHEADVASQKARIAVLLFRNPRKVEGVVV